MSREVPDGWRAGKFDTFITLQRGFDLSVQDRRQGPFAVIASNGQIDSHSEPRIPGPAVVTGRSGTLGKVFHISEGCWPLNTTLYVKNFHGNDPVFVACFLKHFKLDRFGTGTGVPTLNRNVVHEVEVALPPLHEQRRIAEILSSVDEVIAATRAVIEQTRKIRSEILSTSFPEIQAAGSSITDNTFEAWSVEPASSICESIIDCKNRTPPVTGNGYAVVRTPNVRNGRFRYEELQFTDKHSFQEWTAKGMPRVGDILFTREAPYGEVCMAPAMAFCLGQRMMFLRPDTSRVSSDFLLYALQSGPVRKEMFRRAGGSTVGHLRVGDVRELPIPVAPRDVQLRLTSTLRSLDEALSSNGESLSRFEACKSALMSDLLTGRKRVTDVLPVAAE